jgi:cytochrome P450
MRSSYGPGPVWVRVVKDPALLVLSVEDVRRVLGGSPDPFASDPPGKRKGMTAFQPDALTISRDGPWENRRRFNEAVLDTGLTRFSDRFASVVKEEVGVVVREPELTWDAWHRAFQRITRRVVLGDAARSDESLTELLGELMSEANGMPGKPSDRLPELMEQIRGHASAAEPGSLASLFGSAPSDEATRAEGQVPHWLFATHDTLAINSFRCLALLASHAEQRVRALGDDAYMDACLHDAMRLWPTTPMLARETVTDVDWHGENVPAGTQVLIVNTFLHRNPDTHDFADRFAPEEWIGGSAADDWSFNHLSHGPQGCPGSNLALLLGRTMLSAILTDRKVDLVSPKLDRSRPLPHMLDFFSLRFSLAPP